jgi:hypothetical protein
VAGSGGVEALTGAKLALAALHMALAARFLRASLVHPSDWKQQYNFHAHTTLLKARRSHTSNLYNDVQTEIIIKTLKNEEVYRYSSMRT